MLTSGNSGRTIRRKPGSHFWKRSWIDDWWSIKSQVRPNSNPIKNILLTRSQADFLVGQSTVYCHSRLHHSSVLFRRTAGLHPNCSNSSLARSHHLCYTVWSVWRPSPPQLNNTEKWGAPTGWGCRQDDEKPEAISWVANQATRFGEGQFLETET